MYNNDSDDAIRAQEIALETGYNASSGPCDKTKNAPSGLEQTIATSKPWFSVTIDLDKETVEYGLPSSESEERK